MSQSRRPTKNNREIEEARKRIRGEGYPRATIEKRPTTLELLKDELRRCQQEQEKTRALLPDLIRQKNELLKTGDINALNFWRGKVGNKKITHEYRIKEHNVSSETQSLLEDFLYFQNHSHRQNRYSKIKTKVTRGLNLDHENINSEQVEPTGRQDILDAFDEAKIGGPRHRNGFLDWDGNEITERESGQGPRPVRFNELHLWTPACRRVPVGFAATKNRPVEATNLVLDIDDIHQKWQRIEEVEIPEKGQEGFPYRTHIERRQQEQALYRSELGNLRPTTACLHLTKTPDGVKLQDRFRDIQTLDGVFISALESSYDWRTSYDLLGPVKSGIYANFTISDERETIEGPPEDSLNNDDNLIEQPELSKKFKAKGKAKFSVNKKPKKNTKTKDATEDQNTEHMNTEHMNTEHPNTQHPTADHPTTEPPNPSNPPPTTDKRTILDYPYPANEFLNPPPTLHSKNAPSNRPLTLSTPLLSIPWCEETPGRREYHVSMLLSPSSPVDSPPHTPIIHPAPGSIPAPFPNGEISPIAEAAQRRCAHEPERCRAWWSHAADGCWIVESEAVGRRSPVLHPNLEIEVPEEEFVVPEGGRGVYEGRVRDHYGVMGEGWPKVGVRVPYEPMSMDDVRVGSQNDSGEDDEWLGEEGEKVVHEYRAMAAPLIPLVVREGDEGIGGVAADVDADSGNRAGYESDGSDYEGDVFRSMYILGRIGIPTQTSGSHPSQVEGAAES
ncbi:hypothetical protein COCSADRAFT_349781 [Bipolaris sorokiniana ND90Pr]|uniref:Uncharacterized protein n=1 Tax=Cochliobolus sativus (strain ND90Pr / ATCC 201652) TaxID=665912 RepID=M2TGG0_COCSN|nr:uncharacterized protein COCSADRAFT_349781 [Bipolaris sorokiniana ND90Pr]EMD68331.1 hypothetical protein COCSADRAFT_349781 [Bipolaris sorokiniana ND90Pr]